MVFFLFIEKIPIKIVRREEIIVPKTKFQNFIFTLITAVFMAYFMIIYNVATNSTVGLVNKTFLISLKEFYFEWVIVFLLAYFLASPISKRLAFKIINSKKKWYICNIIHSNIYCFINGWTYEYICFICTTFNK